MTRHLIGFDPASLEEVFGTGLDTSDYAALVLFGPLALPGLFSRDRSGPAPEKYKFSKSDPTKTSAYIQAQAGLARAQAAQQGTQTRAPSNTTIPVNVPSTFALNLPASPFASMLPQLPSAPPATDPSTDSVPATDSTPTTDSVQGENVMSHENAAAHVEHVAKHHGLHASIGPNGCTSCPGCGAPLCLRIADGPSCSPGQPAGEVQVIGEDATSNILKAPSDGTCVCSCPKCGVPICLELTHEGYNPEGTTEVVSGYHLLGLQPGVRPVLGSQPGVRPVLGDGGYLPHPGMRPVYGYQPGIRPVLGAPPKNKPSPHKAVIVKAGNAVARAKKSGALASARAKQYDPSKHKPIVPLTAVHGYVGNEAIDVFGNRVHPIEATIDVFGNLNVGEEAIYVHGCTILGADRPLTPAQKNAVARHAAAVIKHAAAVKKAADAGAKATKAAADLDAWRKAKAPIIAKFINRASPSAGQLKAGPAGHQTVLGCSPITVFGLDANGIAPGQPGYDPSTEDGTGAGGGAAGGAGYPAPTPLYDAASNIDPNCVPMPVRGQTLSKDDAQVTWHKCPDDAVKYDGSMGMPSDAFGSWGITYNGSWVNEQSGDGFVWHGQDGNPPIWWAIRHGHGDAQHAGDTIAESSAQFGWGPLVGNPNGPLAGLQWALDDKCWFWQAPIAPAWASVEADTVIAATNKKTMDTDNLAIAADNARIAQEIAQDQEAKAKQDAANALAISAANTQDQIAQQQQAAQQAQVDLQNQQYQQQQAAAQAAADIQAQTLAQQQQAQLQQAQLQMAQLQTQQDAQGRQIQLDYIKAHPELLSQPDQGGGGYAPGSGDGVPMDADPFASDGQSFNDPSDAFTDDAMDMTDGM